MKKHLLLSMTLVLLNAVSIKAQCCAANAGPAKSYCKDSVQIGGSPSYTATCPRGCSVISYSWSPNTGLSNPHVANPWAYPSSTTVYTLQVTITNTNNDTCCKSTSTTTVTFLPRCTANAGSPQTICCAGGTVTIGGSPSAIDSCSGCDSTIYVWMPSSGLSNPHEANPIASPTITTTYTLTIYAYNTTTRDTCCQDSSTVKITKNSTCCRTSGLSNSFSNENYKIYPNPASQNFSIEINNPIQNAKAILYDVNGRIIWQHKNINGNATISVNSSSFEKGIYFLEITENDKKVFRDKLIIE